MSLSSKEITERRLAALISTLSEPKLPSWAVLARQLRVSMTTLRGAMACLGERGLVVSSPRSGTYVKRLVDEPPVPSFRAGRRKAASVVCEAVRADIERGVTRHGSALPKISVMARRLGVGTRAVSAAYASLAGEGLVTRQGRSFVFGRWTEGDASRAGRTDRVIMIFQVLPGHWQRMSEHARLRGFFYSFMQEALSYQIGTVPVAAFGDASSSMPVGGEQILETVHRLGERLLGVLMTMRNVDVDLWESQYCAWIERMCAIGVPVVWLDDDDRASYYHSPGPFTARFLSLVRTPAVRRRLVRCHYSRDHGMRLVVGTLLELGHTEAALVNCVPAFDEWVHHRAGRLRLAAENLGVEFAVHESRDYGRLLDEAPADMSIGEFLERHAPPAGTVAEALRATLVAAGVREQPLSGVKSRPRGWVSAACALACALSGHQTVGAVIAPNDILGNLFHRVFDMAGLRVPRDVSLISFDADPVAMYPYSLTSVDFGFDYLGSQAFHCLLGDRRIPIRKHRSVPGLCRLTHMLTVGPPVT